MATINRAPWTALVDDSGQNLDGSIWNKAAIKTVLLDPIDVALVADATIIAKATGIDTTLTAHGVVIQAMPPLLYTDTLRLTVQTFQNAAAGSTLTLTASGDVTILRLDDMGGGSMAPGSAGLWDVMLRCLTGNTRGWMVKANGSTTGAAGVGTTRVSPLIQPSVSSWLAGGWNLSLEIGASSAGAQLYWGWTVKRE